MKRVLITGSSGMLGKDMVTSLLEFSDIEVYGVDLKELDINKTNFHQRIVDITDLNLLGEFLNRVQPEIIIHTAAIVNLKICEDSFETGKKLHIDVSRELAKTGAKVIYISTDSVFNGSKDNYTEDDIPDPINNYARTKYLGELAIKANSDNYIIIRTNIFGFNKPLRNSLAEWAITNIKEGKEINGFTDVFFNAIYTKHLAKCILQLIKNDFKGLINIASLNTISKYDFINYLGIKSGLLKKEIIKSSIKDIKFTILRPLNTTLSVEKALKYIKIPTIQSGIDELINDYKNDKI